MDEVSNPVRKHKIEGEEWTLWINKDGRRRKVSTKIEITIKKATTGNKIIDYWSQTYLSPRNIYRGSRLVSHREIPQVPQIQLKQ